MLLRENDRSFAEFDSGFMLYAGNKGVIEC